MVSVGFSVPSFSACNDGTLNPTNDSNDDSLTDFTSNATSEEIAPIVCEAPILNISKEC